MLEIFIIPSIGVQTSLRTFRGSGGITEDGSWRALGEQGPGYWAGYMGAAEVGRGGRAGGGHGTTEAKLLSKMKFGTKVSWKDFMNITRR